ncbi:VanZ family protein [Denitratimonas sp. CY0512]|uniref:VanZ family protein n=1 Tax=Denitratimonas sp. CY0512 TaxID=3131940 RepID=UPI0030A497D9
MSRWLLFGSMAVVLIGMLLPASNVGWLRQQLPVLVTIWDWLNMHLPWLNPLHVLLYAWMAMLWGIALPRRGLLQGVLLLFVFSVASEALQLLAPGRNARFSDVANNGLGIILGMAFVMVLFRLSRGRAAKPRAVKPAPGASS